MALQHRKANFLQRAAIHKGISFEDPYILWPDDLLQIAAELDRVLRNDPDILRENDLSNSVKAAEGIIIRTIFKIVDVKNVVFSMITVCRMICIFTFHDSLDDSGKRDFYWLDKGFNDKNCSRFALVKHKQLRTVFLFEID